MWYNHSNVNAEITDENDGVKHIWLTQLYRWCSRLLGKVCYTDDEYAEENGDVEIDQYADEVDVPDE